MSLLNQVLKDLDARRAEGDDRLRLPNEVRSLPPVKRSYKGLWLALGATAALAATTVWWSLGQPVAAGAAVPAAVAPQEMPSVAAPMPIVSISPVDNAGVHAAVTIDSPLLRLADNLASVPATPAASTAAPRVEAKPAAFRAAGATPVPLPSEPHQVERKSSGIPSSAPGNVEKTPREASPNDRAERSHRQGLAAQAQGRTEEAGDLFRAALADDPGHLAARQTLLRMLMEARRFDAAASVLADGLVVLPQRRDWALLLSRLQVDAGDPTGALKTLETSARHGAANADLHAALGAVLHRLARYSEARLHYGQATQLDAASGRWWIGLGLAFEAEGNGGAAKEAFRQALATRSLTQDLQAFAENRVR